MPQARAHHRVLVGVVAALSLAACKDKGSGSADGTGGGTTGAASTGSGATLVTGTGTSGGSSGALDGSGGDGANGECTLWESMQCGAGKKCMPYSVLEDRIPDEIKCCAEVPDPDQVGDPCQIMNYDGSCLDTCADGSMCVLDNDQEKTGECRQFCNPTTPNCGPDETCKSFFEAVNTAPTVPLCMAKCDPLVQDCTQPLWKCIPDTPTASGQSGFICVPPPPTPEKNVFDACGLANDCKAGLVCVPDSRLPSCPYTSCCTAFCALSEGDAACQALDPSLKCVDWMSPDPTWADVGACAIPQ